MKTLFLVTIIDNFYIFHWCPLCIIDSVDYFMSNICNGLKTIFDKHICIYIFNAFIKWNPYILSFQVQPVHSLDPSYPCADGYTGKQCHLQCPYPQYGYRCRRICSCSPLSCHYKNGCPPPGKKKNDLSLHQIEIQSWIRNICNNIIMFWINILERLKTLLLFRFPYKLLHWTLDVNNNSKMSTLFPLTVVFCKH